CRSVWHTPHACTRTTASPGPGSGMTMFSTLTGPPFSSATTPRTFCAILIHLLLSDDQMVSNRTNPLRNLDSTLVPTASVRERAYDPVTELPDVVLTGHQHPAIDVGLRRHRRLAAFAGVEVLLVDPVEQLHRLTQIGTAVDDVLGVEPVAFDDGAVRRLRVHPVEDHVVG